MNADTHGTPGAYEQPTVVELGDVAELTASKDAAQPDALSGEPGDFSPPTVR